MWNMKIENGCYDHKLSRLRIHSSFVAVQSS